MNDFAISTGRLLVVSFLNSKAGDASIIRAEGITAPDEAPETRADEPPDETSAEGPDHLDDLTNDRAEDRDTQADQTEKQRSNNLLHELETSSRDRFILLDRLLDHLAAAREFLTQQMDGRFNTL